MCELAGRTGSQNRFWDFKIQDYKFLDPKFNSNSKDLNSNFGTKMNFEQKWKLMNVVQDQLEKTKYKAQDTQYEERVAVLQDKVGRILDLKEKLDTNIEDVRKQYLTLTRERNIYLEKWKLIEAIGQENNWEDSKGIL